MENNNVLTVLSSTDILEKEFRTELRGYSVTEVDDFLDEIISDYEKMYKEIDRLKEENSKLKAQSKKDLSSLSSESSVQSKITTSNVTNSNYDLLKRVNLLEKQVVEIMKHLRKR